ncbi:MAG: hypothetical protein KKA07_07235 [Bacteroidetes bacterium]|nr:hypothetical protein [Bacteroidota bacterium]MBU1718853.1 hypothetical protein [Bacteroidota bacterium]
MPFNQENILGISDLRRLYEVMREKHRQDYSHYAATSLKRRIEKFIADENISFEVFLEKISENQAFLRSFRDSLPVKGTELFRDPSLWRLLRDSVLPSLIKKDNLIRIWIPDVSTGEDLLSLLIVLKESGLRNSVLIDCGYNDFENPANNQEILYSSSHREISSGNYKRYNDKSDLENYFGETTGGYTFSTKLFKGISFSPINLLRPEKTKPLYNLILCRNILLYYSQQQHDRLTTVLADALLPEGLLILGHYETISFSRDAGRYRSINETETIYQKNMENA